MYFIIYIIFVWLLMHIKRIYNLDWIIESFSFYKETIWKYINIIISNFDGLLDVGLIRGLFFGIADFPRLVSIALFFYSFLGTIFSFLKYWIPLSRQYTIHNILQLITTFSILIFIALILAFQIMYWIYRGVHVLIKTIIGLVLNKKDINLNDFFTFQELFNATLSLRDDEYDFLNPKTLTIVLSLIICISCSIFVLLYGQDGNRSCTTKEYLKGKIHTSQTLAILHTYQRVFTLSIIILIICFFILERINSTT